MHLISALGRPYLEEKKIQNKVRETKYKFTMQNDIQKRNGSNTKHEGIAGGQYTEKERRFSL